MSVRMRHTHSHTKNRRSHHALEASSVVVTEKGTLRQPHRLDEATGTYRGNVIKAPKQKKERTKAEKHNHPEHVHAEPVADTTKKETPEVAGTHEHEKGTPKTRSNAS